MNGFVSEKRTHRRSLLSNSKVRHGYPGVRSEEESKISHWNTLGFQLREPGTKIIKKIRYCFLWHQQYFELDVFQNPAGRVYLEIELTEANDAIDLPPFIEVERDVTEEAGHSTTTFSPKLFKTHPKMHFKSREAILGIFYFLARIQAIR